MSTSSSAAPRAATQFIAHIRQPNGIVKRVTAQGVDRRDAAMNALRGMGAGSTAACTPADSIDRAPARRSGEQ